MIRRFLVGALLQSFLLVGSASAAPVDSVAVRYYSPETGGVEKPRYISTRQLSFFIRIDALENDGQVSDEAAIRYEKLVTSRLIAEDMLASLALEHGTDPSDLPALVREARLDLEARVGGQKALAQALVDEKLNEAELDAFLTRKVRAGHYVDRAIAPLRRPPEDELYRAFRTARHPYRQLRYEDARARMERWYAYERLRSLSIEFVEGARARLFVVRLPDP